MHTESEFQALPDLPAEGTSYVFLFEHRLKKEGTWLQVEDQVWEVQESKWAPQESARTLELARPSQSCPLVLELL